MASTSILKFETLLLTTVVLTLQLSFVTQTNGAAVVRKVIHTDLAPSTTLPLSQAVQVGDTIYVSGQLGMLMNGTLVEGIEAQTRLALEYIGHILRAADADFSNVVKTTVLLANISDSALMSEIYRPYFPINKYPARAAYQVGHLPMDALIEIEAVAISGQIVDI